jgi:hypothetical protein
LTNQNQEKNLISITERIYNEYEEVLNKKQYCKLPKLEKWVKEQYIERYGEEPKKILRTTNGHQTYINVYEEKHYREFVDDMIQVFYHWDF